MSDDAINCWKCGLPMTTEEIQENTSEEPRCRKCTVMQQRLQDFRNHINDDDYWNGDEVQLWEWWAWRITEDYVDSAILQRDLRQMMEDKLTVEDYNKIIEVLAMMMLSHKYTKDASMGDSR